jgi:hypothetical protein
VEPLVQPQPGSATPSAQQSTSLALDGRRGTAPALVVIEVNGLTRCSITLYPANVSGEPGGWLQGGL